MSTKSLVVREFGVPPKWEEEYPSSNPRELPKLAVVREVDIAITGKRISIEFSRANRRIALTPAYGIKELLKDVTSGNFKFPDPISPKPTGKHKSPLSINNDDLCYVIYCLTDKDWQFAQKGAPITLGTVALEKNAYFESCRVDSTGAPDYGSGSKDNCRVAYIIADGKAALNGQSEYSDAINLHVDLVYERPGEEPQYIPIIIDPDIRHPGGVGP